jgi:hypothetical protein
MEWVRGHYGPAAGLGSCYPLSLGVGGLGSPRCRRSGADAGSIPILAMLRHGCGGQLAFRFPLAFPSLYFPS